MRITIKLLPRQMSLIAGFLLAGTAIPVLAQNLSVTGNSVTVTSGASVSPSALPISANGIVTTTTITSAGGVTGASAIPNFTYTLASTGVTDGTYTFRAGFVIDDNNSARRMEISIPSLTMTFSSSGTVLAGSVPAGSTVKVLGVLRTTQRSWVRFCRIACSHFQVRV